jgi:hypothetical protein
MGVKISERDGAWYLVVDFRGRRKSKSVERDEQEHIQD